MRRGFLVFVLLSVGAFYGWEWGITEGGIGRAIERHPTTIGGDRILFSLGGFHELFNQDQKALVQYQRVVTLYPDSKFSESSQFGVASSYERMHQKTNAIKAYQKYLEEYPEGKFHNTVSNSIYYLKWN